MTTKDDSIHSHAIYRNSTHRHAIILSCEFDRHIDLLSFTCEFVRQTHSHAIIVWVELSSSDTSTCHHHRVISTKIIVRCRKTRQLETRQHARLARTSSKITDALLSVGHINMHLLSCGFDGQFQTRRAIILWFLQTLSRFPQTLSRFP
jgi:hypothetical protein